MQRPLVPVHSLLTLPCTPSLPLAPLACPSRPAPPQATGLCKGRTCRDTWSIIHPGGGVSSLDQALDPRYDAYYAQYTQFSFRACTKYYDPVNNEVTDAWLGGLSRWGPQRTTPQPVV